MKLTILDHNRRQTPILNEESSSNAIPAGQKRVIASSTALGLFLYANDYDGKLPLNEVGRWLLDISYWTTDIILKTGAFDRDIFYCPSWRQRGNIISWRYGENLAAAMFR